MKINYKVVFLMIVGFQSYSMHAAMREYDVQGEQYQQTMRMYEQRKQDIQSAYRMSSSFFDRIKKELVQRKVSEANIEKILAGCRRSVMLEIDFEARSNIEGGYFMITPEFFGNFFKDLQDIISASFVLFRADPEANNFLQKKTMIFLDKIYPSLEHLNASPQPFKMYYSSMVPDPRIEQVYESLHKAYDLQGELLQNVIIQDIEYEDLEDLHKIVLHNYEKLQDMYYFLEAKWMQVDEELIPVKASKINVKQRSRAKFGS